MIKKSLLSFMLLIGIASGVYAQDEFDALKASQLPLKGTARFMSMGGAFTALGGDASAISLNPAGLGAYRSSEVTATLNLLNSGVKSSWNGMNSNDNNLFVHFNNFSIVLTVPGNDQISSALAFTYDRIKSFDRSGSMNGSSQISSLTKFLAYKSAGLSQADLKYTDNYEPYSNTYVPWLSVLGYESYLINPSTTGTNQWQSVLGSTESVLPSYNFTERGYVDQYSVSWGGNLSDIFYFGASVGWQSLSYSLISNYGEQFQLGGNMNLQNEMYTTGSGFDVKLGVTVRPTDFLRLGFAYHTPTFYKMTDTYYAAMTYDSFDEVSNKNVKGIAYTPSEGGYDKYKIQTPSSYNFGIAGVIGKKGILSFDYQYQDFTTVKLKDQNGNTSAFKDENSYIKDDLKGVSTFKVGAEYRATGNIALRVGYNYIAPATKSTAFRWLPDNSMRTDSEYALDVHTNVYTAGIGFKFDNLNIDLAYILSDQKQNYYPYNDINLNPASVTTRNSNLALTVGIRY